jgi:ABC-2 type transport system permease protein
MTTTTANDITVLRASAIDESLPSVLSTHDPLTPTSAWSASLAFGWRALLKIKHVPEQMADAILIPVIFTVLFTYLFGGALAGSTSEYLQVLLPGTLVMTVLLATVYAGLGLNTDISSGVFDRYRSLPIWRPAPIVGALLGESGRYLLASGRVNALGLAMGFRPEGGAIGMGLAIGLMLLVALALAWMWTTIGLVMRSPTAVTTASFVILFPLTMASNIYVQPDTLPDWLQTFVEINPVSHLVTAVRGLMDGTATVDQIGWTLAATAALTALFAPLTMRLYRHK